MTTRHTNVLQRLRSQSAKPKSTSPGPGDYQGTELHRNAGALDLDQILLAGNFTTNDVALVLQGRAAA